MSVAHAPFVFERCYSIDATERLIVRASLPYLTESGWNVDVAIEKPDGTDSRIVHGFDQIQTMMLAFECVRIELERLGARVNWLDGEPGDSGIGRQLPLSYGVKFRKHLDLVIEREETAFVEAAVRARRPK